MQKALPPRVALDEVFVPGGLPSITYVPREERKLEDELRSAIFRPHEIILLLGATKSGKTVLTQTVIPQERLVLVEGTRVDTRVERFWSQAASQLGLGTKTIESDTREDGRHKDIETEVGAKVPVLGWLSGRFRGSGGTSHSKRVGTAVHREVDEQEDTIKALVQSDKVLVIEDFHAISANVQSSIIRALKGPIFQGMRVVVIGIPHREHDVELAMKDMADRTKRIRIPMWNRNELKQICDRGFEALNILPAANMVKQFCTHAYGSPNLLQQFCRKVCENHGVRESRVQKLSLGLGGRYETFFEEFAEGSNSDVRRIVAEFRSPRESRLKKYQLKDGRVLNIYQLVLSALRAKLPAQDVAAGEVDDVISTMVEGDGPETEEVTRALSRLGDLAKQIADEERVGQPVLEWNDRLRKLHITDASFAFHVKWGPL